MSTAAGGFAPATPLASGGCTAPPLRISGCAAAGFNGYFEIVVSRIPENLPSLQGHHLGWKQKGCLMQIVLNRLRKTLQQSQLFIQPPTSRQKYQTTVSTRVWEHRNKVHDNQHRFSVIREAAMSLCFKNMQPLFGRKNETRRTSE